MINTVKPIVLSGEYNPIHNQQKKRSKNKPKFSGGSTKVRENKEIRKESSCERNTTQHRNWTTTQQELCSATHGCATPRPHESQRSTELRDVAAVSRDVVGERASPGWPTVRRQTTLLATHTTTCHFILLQTFVTNVRFMFNWQYGEVKHGDMLLLLVYTKL